MVALIVCIMFSGATMAAILAAIIANKERNPFQNSDKSTFTKGN